MWKIHTGSRTLRKPVICASSIFTNTNYSSLNTQYATDIGSVSFWFNAS